MSLSERDQRALKLLGGALALAAVLYFWPGGEVSTATAVQAGSADALEKRLKKSRDLMMTVPDKQAFLKQAQADLAVREKGLIIADTAAQAQAQLFQILRRIGRSQSPPVEIRANEIGNAKPYGDAYGEVSVTVSFECAIEQLVNLLADLGAQPEALATNEVHIGEANQQQKLIPVRLTVAGVVPRKIIPEKKAVTF
ncbi:MAG: hypothetical protein FJW30_05160 [Acidobacteria bacterium]|nr:hypothetical protein [Acidobacteriota bacterium]